MAEIVNDAPERYQRGFWRRVGRRHGGAQRPQPQCWSLFLLVPYLALGLPTERADAAGGAFLVDDAEVGKVGSCKVESWVSSADNRDFISAVAPACTVDITRPVELQPGFVRFRSDGEWGTDFVFRGKTNILPVDTGMLGLGLIGGTAFDLLTGDNIAVFANVPATNQLSEQLRINLNAGWLWDRRDPADERHLFSWGAGVEWVPVDKVTLIAEVFGFVGGLNNDPRFQAGIRFTPVRAFDIDLIYGHNITGERADWITLGLNVRFDAFVPK
jgi:hypothetical protein